jgi:hypothetical protein
MTRTPRPVAVATAVLGAFLLAGCAARSVQINEIAVFGGQSIGLHIEESDRRIRG